MGRARPSLARSRAARPRPPRSAAYMARSAAWSSCWAAVPWSGSTATPTLAPSSTAGAADEHGAVAGGGRGPHARAAEAAGHGASFQVEGTGRSIDARAVRLDEAPPGVFPLPTRERSALTLVANAPLGIALFDGDLRHVPVNPQLAEMNGVPEAQLVGRTPSEVNGRVGAEAGQLYRQVMRSAMRDVNITGEVAAGPGVVRRRECELPPGAGRRPDDRAVRHLRRRHRRAAAAR